LLRAASAPDPLKVSDRMALLARICPGTKLIVAGEDAGPSLG